MINTVNNKFKTQMCRHWEQTGNCQLGPRCHFAHGKEELRTMNDPVPMNQSGGWQTSQPMQKSYSKPNMGMGENNFSPSTQMNNQAPPNYKTVFCKFFEQGFCKFQDKCNFAHSPDELRDASMMRPKPMGGQQRTGGMGMSRGGGMGRGEYRGGMRGGMGGGMGGDRRMGGGMGGDRRMGGGMDGDMGGDSGEDVSGGMGGKMNPTISREMMMSNQYGQQQQSKPQQSTSTNSQSPLSESAIQNQIAQTQIEYLIQQLETYHKNDREYSEVLQNAKETLYKGNIKAAAAMLNEIMQREDKSSEDNENYNAYVANIQQLGNKLYTQYSQQQAPQNSMNGGSPTQQQSPTGNYKSPTMQSGGYQQGGGYGSNGF